LTNQRQYAQAEEIKKTLRILEIEEKSKWVTALKKNSTKKEKKLKTHHQS